MKQKFLAVHDYGTGGLWAYILAETEEEIHRLLPQFQIVRERPGWMTSEQEARLDRETFDVHEPPQWLSRALEADAEAERER